jgi:hypothetical protein
VEVEDGSGWVGEKIEKETERDTEREREKELAKTARCRHCLFQNLWETASCGEPQRLATSFLVGWPRARQQTRTQRYSDGTSALRTHAAHTCACTFFCCQGCSSAVTTDQAAAAPPTRAAESCDKSCKWVHGTTPRMPIRTQGLHATTTRMPGPHPPVGCSGSTAVK